MKFLSDYSQCEPFHRLQPGDFYSAAMPTGRGHADPFCACGLTEICNRDKNMAVSNRGAFVPL
jgi:hypothetical protein